MENIPHPIVSVFTPVYNRAHTICRVYDSLCRQTCSDFEWIVINDGSDDNIQQVMKSLMDKGEIKINFITQERGGKYRAFNKGLELAKGVFIFVVDSDDSLAINAIELILKYGKPLLDNPDFAGLSGLDVDMEGKMITKFPFLSPIDSTPIDIRTKYKILGDLSEVFKTDIIKKFMFPQIKGELFCSEALLLSRLTSADLKIRYYPEIFKIVEYLPDGISKNINFERIKSPVLSFTLYKELIALKQPFSHKFKWSINLWRFFFHSKPIKKKETLPYYWILTLPLGFLLFLKDKIIY